MFPTEKIKYILATLIGNSKLQSWIAISTSFFSASTADQSVKINQMEEVGF